MNELHQLADDLGSSLDDLEPIQHAIGQVGKRVAIEEIERDTGGDRRLSGVRSRARLGAGYDLGQPVLLNLRPKGLILLRSRGRRKPPATIHPRRRRGARRALSTPYGPRAYVRGSSTSGTKLVERIAARSAAEIEPAVADAVVDLFDVRLS